MSLSGGRSKTRTNVPRGSDIDIKRTPDVLENEFVTIITIATLLMTAATSLAGSVDMDRLHDYCKDSNPCYTRGLIWTPLYLSSWTSGAAFFISFIVMLAYRFKNILPTDVEIANTFFEQFKEEIYLSYAFGVISMVFLFASMCFYFVLQYDYVAIYVLNVVGIIFVSFMSPYVYRQYKINFLSKVHELDIASEKDRIMAVLETIGCARYIKRITGAKVTYDQLSDLTVDELVNYMNIPLGDAKKMTAHFSDMGRGSEEEMTETENTMHRSHFRDGSGD